MTDQPYDQELDDPLDGEAFAPADPAETAQLAQVASSAPQVPWTITVAGAVRHFTRLPNGGCVLHFTAAQQMPGGMIGIMPPRIDIPFSPDAWDAFKREVENDGQASQIAVARTLPGAVLPPGVR